MQLVIIESPFAGGDQLSFNKLFESEFKLVCMVGMNMILLRTDCEKTAAREVALKYARAAMRDCLQRGEAPYASHLLYTQPGVLDDDKPDERALGIEAGLQWGAVAYKTVVYTDLGISEGMRQGIDRAKCDNRDVEYRTLPGWS